MLVLEDGQVAGNSTTDIAAGPGQVLGLAARVPVPKKKKIKRFKDFIKGEKDE